jgi:hypothetical protein
MLLESLGLAPLMHVVHRARREPGCRCDAESSETPDVDESMTRLAWVMALPSATSRAANKVVVP